MVGAQSECGSGTSRHFMQDAHGKKYDYSYILVLIIMRQLTLNRYAPIQYLMRSSHT